MSIWFHTPNLNEFKQFDEGLHQQGTIMKTLGIQLSDIDDHSLSATLQVTPKTHNPFGVLHGGVNVVLAETVASYAANCVIDFSHYYAVGQEISASHLKPISEGMLTAKATSIHTGRSSSVWHVDITNEKNQLTCSVRMTAAVLPRKNTLNLT